MLPLRRGLFVGVFSLYMFLAVEVRSNDDEADDKMSRAYKLADILFRRSLQDEGISARKTFEGIKQEEVIVVSGSYDRIADIFRKSRIPHTSVEPRQVVDMDLKPSQIVFVNCGSSFPENGAKRLAQYVKSGGRLITTYWALKNVLEVAFPGFVKFNGKSTDDDVVAISEVNRKDPVLSGFLEEDVATSSPVWWLESSSYPIQILDEENVEVLASSEELGQKYGESAVIVKFKYGRGTVYHLISHFYLQRTEFRDKRHSADAFAFATDKAGGVKGTGSAYFEEDELKGNEDVLYGDLEAATASYEFIARNVLEHSKELMLVDEEKIKSEL